MKKENFRGKMKDLIPEYNKWLHSTEEEYREKGVPLTSRVFRQANRYFPEHILADSMIIRTNQFPQPPFAELGFPELEYWDKGELNGVTFGKLIFIDPVKESVSLVFHESVHIAQGYFLGYDNYHLAYGLSILSDTYEKNPFELVARELEGEFERNAVIPNLIDYIERESRKAWEKLKGYIR